MPTSILRLSVHTVISLQHVWKHCVHKVDFFLQVLDKMLQSQEDIKGLYCVGSCTESSDEESISSVKGEESSADYKTIQECLEDIRSRGELSW